MSDEGIVKTPTDLAHPTPRKMEEEPDSVLWEFWKIAQSQYHYRPLGVVDLGEID